MTHTHKKIRQQESQLLGHAGTRKRTLNRQVQTLPSLATTLHNPVQKSITEIFKLAQFSTPRCRWHPALESPPEDAPLQGCPPQGWLPHVCWDVHSPTLGLVSQLGTTSISSVTASPERKGNGEGQWDMRRGKPHIFRSELKKANYFIISQVQEWSHSFKQGLVRHGPGPEQ